jgi:hypothetical protein
MSATLPHGKVRRPVPAAWDAPGYLTKAMLGVGVGVALYAGALVCIWLLAAQTLCPPLLTPLFAVPLAAALFGLGRIGIVGALVLVAGTTAAHFLAFIAAAYVYDGTPVFATPAERAADAVRAQLNGLLCGAVGGAAGAALSFGLIATLAPGLRDRRRLSEYAFATLALTALGAAGLGSLLSSGHGGLEPPGIIFLLYIPWQAAFGYAIVSVFKDHQAVRYVRAAG